MDITNLTPKPMRKGKNGKRGTRYYDSNDQLVAKTCATCGDTLHITDFATAKAQPDQLSSSCRECTKNYQKNYHESGPVKPQTPGRDQYVNRTDEEIAQYLSAKFPDNSRECTLCRQTKPLTHFYQNKSNPSVVQSRCKECMKSHGSTQHHR